MMPDAFSYDAVDYPSKPLPQAHAGHLYALARMFGGDPVPPDRGRVLELGCGDGSHLIASALTLPHATFVGLDLSAVAVARGRQTIAELGLTNVTLDAIDVTAWRPASGSFDYVVAHGLYSWVPAVVRHAIWRIYATALGPTGVGYVSYNAYPGCYVRRMIWEMMRHHVNDAPDPAKRISLAVEFAQFLQAGLPEKSVAAVKADLEEIVRPGYRGVLYHDDLSASNEPFYFHEFMAAAGGHGFRFLCEAEPHMAEVRGFPPDVAAILTALGEQDVLKKEQYADFLRLRRFRQTLLMKDGRTPMLRPDATRLETLALSGQPKAEEATVNVSSSAAVTFRGGGDGRIRTDQPLGKAALVTLGEVFPRRVPFAELAARAAKVLGRGVPTAEEHAQLAELLTAVWMAGLIEVHGTIPTYADTPSDTPLACPFARIQLRTGAVATTRLFTPMSFDDPPSRRMIELMDGTRTRDQIATELAASFPVDKRPDARSLRAGLDRHLTRLARGGLLVG